MPESNKNKEDKSLISSSDIVNMENVFSLALKGADGNRVDLKNLLTYEELFKLKMTLTLQLIHEMKK